MCMPIFHTCIMESAVQAGRLTFCCTQSSDLSCSRARPKDVKGQLLHVHCTKSSAVQGYIFIRIEATPQIVAAPGAHVLKTIVAALE